MGKDPRAGEKLKLGFHVPEGVIYFNHEDTRKLQETHLLLL